MTFGFNLNTNIGTGNLFQPSTNINLGVDYAMNNIFPAANAYSSLSMPGYGGGDSTPYAMGAVPLTGSLFGGFRAPNFNSAMNNIFTNTAMLSIPPYGAGDSTPYAMGSWPMAGGYLPSLLGGFPCFGGGIFGGLYGGGLFGGGNPAAMFAVGQGMGQLAAAPFVAASNLIGSIFNFGCKRG